MLEISVFLLINGLRLIEFIVILTRMAATFSFHRTKLFNNLFDRGILWTGFFHWPAYATLIYCILDNIFEFVESIQKGIMLGVFGQVGHIFCLFNLIDDVAQEASSIKFTIWIERFGFLFGLWVGRLLISNIYFFSLKLRQEAVCLFTADIKMLHKSSVEVGRCFDQVLKLFGRVVCIGSLVLPVIHYLI